MQVSHTWSKMVDDETGEWCWVISDQDGKALAVMSDNMRKAMEKYVTDRCKHSKKGKKMKHIVKISDYKEYLNWCIEKQKNDTRISDRVHGMSRGSFDALTSEYNRCLYYESNAHTNIEIDTYCVNHMGFFEWYVQKSK